MDQDVTARLEQLEAEVRELRAQVPDRGTEREPIPRLTRRALLLGGAAAGAGIAGAALAGSPAGATDPNDVAMGATNDAGAGGTSLTSTAATTMTLANGTSTSVALNLAAGGVSGAPGAGTHSRGDFYIDASGRLYLCASGGTPGVWRQVALSGLTNQDTSGSPTTFSGNASAGAAITVTNVDGGGSPLALVAGNITGAPTSGNHSRGELFVDTNGALFQCIADGGPGTWVRQSPLVPLAAPVRIYYSLTAGDGPLPDATERSVAVTNGTTIPHNVSAVLTNLAVTPAGSSGFLAMFKDGTTWPGTSNVNFPAGQFASNNATSAVKLGATASDPATVKIRIGGATAHFVIDVFGYYP